MSKVFRLIFYSVFVLALSAWLVRLSMLLIIPLPFVSDEMIDFVLQTYGPNNQDEVASALALLGFVIWIPLVTLLGWVLLKTWRRLRRHAPS